MLSGAKNSLLALIWVLVVWVGFRLGTLAVGRLLNLLMEHSRTGCRSVRHWPQKKKKHFLAAEAAFCGDGGRSG